MRIPALTAGLFLHYSARVSWYIFAPWHCLTFHNFARLNNNNNPLFYISTRNCPNPAFKLRSVHECGVYVKNTTSFNRE